VSDEHWLRRLDEHGWIAAAQRELDACESSALQRRAAVAHARRAAGMALNGVLIAWVRREPELAVESIWGRSYVDHLRAVAAGATGPLAGEASVLAQAVLATPIAAGSLVSLGRRNPELTAQQAGARELVRACAEAIVRLRAL
jgi:hypothetical protein